PHHRRAGEADRPRQGGGERGGPRGPPRPGRGALRRGGAAQAGRDGGRALSRSLGVTERLSSLTPEQRALFEALRRKQQEAATAPAAPASPWWTESRCSGWRRTRLSISP